MRHVPNRACIRRLSIRSFCANRTRNLIAILAIVLTSILFTSLFTIALSINHSFQQSNFRQARRVESCLSQIPDQGRI